MHIGCEKYTVTKEFSLGIIFTAFYYSYVI